MKNKMHAYGIFHKHFLLPQKSFNFTIVILNIFYEHLLLSQTFFFSIRTKEEPEERFSVFSIFKRAPLLFLYYNLLAIL